MWLLGFGASDFTWDAIDERVDCKAVHRWQVPARLQRATCCLFQADPIRMMLFQAWPDLLWKDGLVAHERQAC
jgi:hypothetical protein